MKLYCTLAFVVLFIASCKQEAKKPSPTPKKVVGPAFEKAGEAITEPAKPGKPAGPEMTKVYSADRTPQQVIADLKAKNPDLDSKRGAVFIAEGGNVTKGGIGDPAVTDISPLRGLPLVYLELKGSSVKDLSPLAGMPLKQLFIENTHVEDLTPLAGMPLTHFAANNTKVRNISALRGAPIKELRLFKTQVNDISALRGMPLEQLWLNECPVSDIGPLAEAPLVSLTLERTYVADLTPLKGAGLQRLHIGDSKVTDLTPLQGLPLTRLIFTPKKIKKGIGVIREMKTLREIGPTLAGKMPPALFWKFYDDGRF